MNRIISLVLIALIFVSCTSISNYQKVPPKDMVKFDKVETINITRFWLPKPATFSDYQRGQASVVDSKYYDMDVQIIGKIKYSPTSFFETGTPTDFYVGYNETVGYIYGYVFLVDEDLKDRKYSEIINDARNTFLAYYETIKPAAVSSEVLNSYKEITARAENADVFKGEKIFLNLIPKTKTSGGNTLETATNFSITGNPIYSEVAGSFVLINFHCIGSSSEASSILNGNHSGITRIMIWGTIIDTSYVDPLIQVDYIQFIISGLQEKIIKVDKQK